jgi:hypothetical protein
MQKRILTGLTLLSCLTWSTCFAADPSVPAEPSPKEKDIRRLLGLMNASSMGAQVMGQLRQVFSQQNPNIPAAFWDNFMSKAKPEDMTDMIVPIYDKHLSHDDIKELCKFYETPVAKKFVAQMPKIMQESMAVGQKWGADLAEKVIAELKKQNISLGSPAPGAPASAAPAPEAPAGN